MVGLRKRLRTSTKILGHTCMAVRRAFQARTELNAIPAIADSLGTHLAAKLQVFGSDERTLTDELCDMLCIWAGLLPTMGFRSGQGNPRASTGIPGPLPRIPILLQIEKVSQRREHALGADLEIRVHSPLGTKRLSAQAKVLDPDDHKLRCDSPKEWEKLRVQLVNCRHHAGPLAFLLVYVPMDLLRRVPGIFATWEQGHVLSGTGPHSRFGASLIPADYLLDIAGNWIGGRRPEIVHGRLVPAGLSLTRVLLEMLACLRGQWKREATLHPSQYLAPMEVTDDGAAAYRTVEIGVDELDESTWEALTDDVRAAAETFGQQESNDVGEGGDRR